MSPIEKLNQSKNVVKIKPKLEYKHYSCDVSNCSLECLSSVLNLSTRKFQRLYPVFQKSVKNVKSDPLLSLVHKKQVYVNKIAMIKSSYQKYKNQAKISKQIKCYREMQLIMSEDPDKYFCSNYNWYFTGGNLKIQEIGDAVILLHPYKNSKLYATQIESKGFKWQTKKESTLDKSCSDIYQIDSVSNNQKTFVNVRQKNEVRLYDINLNENGDLECKLANTQKDLSPYVSLSMNKENVAEFATVNVKHKVQIFDLLKPVCNYNITHIDNTGQEDCFAQVSFYDNNMLAYINRNNFYFFDKRTNVVCNKFKITDFEILNDKFVNICPNAQNCICYISTFDNISLLDLRRQNIFEKYSHSFTSAPYLSDFLNTGNNKYFCVSSYKPDEKLIFEQGEIFNYLPISLPSLTDSFESDLLLNPNINMSIHIRQRLKSNITGMQVWLDNFDSVNVFCVNSLGNIYCHDIKTEDFWYNDINNEFQKWNNILKSSHVEELLYNNKKVLKDIKFNFKSEPAEYLNVIKNKRLQDSVNELKKRKKGFKDKICDLWYLPEHNLLKDIEETSTYDTVQTWLKQYCSHPVDEFSDNA